jgi:hypothetical protein
MSMTSGARMIARATATRCRWPPESLAHQTLEIRIESERSRHLRDRGARLRSSYLAHLQRKGDVPPNRHVRVEGVVLKHHRHISLAGWPIVHEPIAEEHAATRRVIETGDQP